MTANLRNLEQERAHLLGFLATLQNGPTGVACIGGKPDLQIRSEHGLLGVEHTRLFHSAGGASAARESLQDQIAREAWDLHRRKGGPALLVHIYFTEGRLTKRDIQPYAERIQALVAGTSLRPRESTEIEAWRVNRSSPGAAPSELQSIWVQAEEDEDAALWGVARGGGVPELNRSLLESRIAEKERLAPAYRKRCSSLWLLLVADGFTPATHFKIPAAIADRAYQTDFDRLFVFHHFNRQLVELPTSPLTQLIP